MSKEILVDDDPTRISHPLSSVLLKGCGEIGRGRDGRNEISVLKDCLRSSRYYRALKTPHISELEVPNATWKDSQSPKYPDVMLTTKRTRDSIQLDQKAGARRCFVKPLKSDRQVSFLTIRAVG